MSEYVFSPGGGQSQLIYDYTCTAAKSSIDTNVDGPMARLFPTDGGILEAYLVARTDEAVVRSGLTTRLNNDSGSNYDLHDVYALNATPASDGATLAAAQWTVNVNGASCAANFFSCHHLILAAYGDTTAYKRASMLTLLGDSTAANNVTGQFALGYRSTSAITRMSLAPATAGKSFVAGSRLLVYRR